MTSQQLEINLNKRIFFNHNVDITTFWLLFTRWCRMTHIIVTGAQGFLGSRLIDKLLKRPEVSKISLIDQKFYEKENSHKLQYFEGDLTSPEFLNEIFKSDVDVVFHLASIPGAAAEKQPHVAQDINFLSVQRILNLLEKQKIPPKFIFASSIAVYGNDSQDIITEYDLINPQTLYATHKSIVELLIADASRRNIINGLSLRVPGLVARPEKANGFASSFMSEIFWSLKNDEHIILPVSKESTAWWLSVDCAAENFIFAAFNDFTALNARRVIQLPVLYLTVSEIIQEISNYLNEDKTSLISYDIDPYIQANFGAFPPLISSYSESKGFFNDHSISALIRRVYE